MLGYVTIGTNDFEKAKTFYDKALAAMGARRTMTNDRMQGFGVKGSRQPRGEWIMNARLRLVRLPAATVTETCPACCDDLPTFQCTASRRGRRAGGESAAIQACTHGQAAPWVTPASSPAGASVVPFERMAADAAGYSATPLPRKLGIAPGARVAALGAPPGFAERLDGATVRTRLGGDFDVIVLFAGSRAQLERRLPGALGALAAGGGLWLAWPKRSSGRPTDLDERLVRERGLATGLVDNKVCAIDATWSGLRFMRRRAAR